MRIHATAFLLASSALTLAVPAWAQNAAAEDRAEESSIVVTGTRIVRDGYTAPTPVTVALAEELARSTPTSISDALNKLPQFQNSFGPGRTASNFSNFPLHGNVLNLRGLGTPGFTPKGPLRTLVLLDGLRMPPTTFAGFVDANVIPNLLVQRVDVVTGGASAAWGSDAVAGVVNFVLDKKFTGIKGVAQAGISQEGDNANHRLGAAYGTSFADDRGHILLSAEYSKNNGMLRSAREIGRLGYAYAQSIGTNTCVAPATDPTACAAGGTLNPYRIITDVRIPTSNVNGRITAASNVGNTFVGQVINPDGTTRPFVNGISTAGGISNQIGGDGYRIPDDTSAIKPVKTYGAFGRLSYDLTPDINAYVQGVWSRSDLDYFALANSAINSVTGLPFGTIVAAGLANGVPIYKGNPFLSVALDASLPTANDFLLVSQYGSLLPKPHVRERTDFWMATTGLDGSIGDFKWKLAYSHGNSKSAMDQSGLYDNKKLYAAIDVVNVNGVKTCRVLTDPAVAAQYVGCQPLDLLHGQPTVSTPTGYAYATGTSRYRASIKQDTFNASLSGSLFEMPAGPIDIAAGVEWRKQTLLLTSNADPTLLVGTSTDPATFTAQTTAIRAAYFAGLRGVGPANLFYNLTNVGGARGSLTVKEAFAEIAVPLLKDKPFFTELGLNGAVRVTDYSTSGTVTTWKAGATWKPVDGLLFRGSYSRDIRAPNLYELFRGDQSGISIINDQAVNGYGSNILGSNVPQLNGGNPFLKPEIAKTLTFGAVISPTALPGFSLSIDYYRINLTGLIDSLSAQQLVLNCNASGGTAPECALITRASPTSFPTSIRVADANSAFLKTAGIDFDISYRTTLGEGALGIQLYANYLDKFQTQLYAGSTPATTAPILNFAGVNVVGSNPVAYPRLRGNLSINYEIGRFGVTVTETYIGKMKLDVPGGLAGGVRSNFVGATHVGAVGYTDLTLRYSIPHNDGKIEIFGTVNNLFNKQPPIIPGITAGVNLPTNISVYDVIGRAFTGGVRFKF